MKTRGLRLMLTALLFVGWIGNAHSQTYSVLYNFGAGPDDPQLTQFGYLIQGRDGKVYGASASGLGKSAAGTIYRVSTAGKLTVVHSLAGGDGAGPYGGLTLGTDGNFYGTTNRGGAFSYGTVFKASANGTLTVLHDFSNGSDGSYPWAPPIQGTDGNYYGTATSGGSGYGTVYKITPSGTVSTLNKFDGVHGAYPYAQLVQADDGNFYGTTLLGGQFNDGVIFKITPHGKLSVLYSFDSGKGELLEQPLIHGNDGNFYGTAPRGGQNNGGVAFKMTPGGELTLLHDMNPSNDGSSPLAGLTAATDSKFYGVNQQGGPGNNGTIFRVSAKGVFEVLYDFDSTTGAEPEVGLVQHTNGILYGATSVGGTFSKGVFYSLNVGLGPFVRLLPGSGKVGKSIGILGQGFTGTTAVSFNGTPANFTVTSDTFLKAAVPSGATTGFVTVTTPGGTLKSNTKFRVTPRITSFSPQSGPVGTPVTITGISLTQTTKVAFGGVQATNFTVDSDTQVTATVPIGAQTGKIVIKTAGGIARSATDFTVTP